MPEHRIGIFLCECGGEMSNALDLEALASNIEALASGARSHPDVVFLSTKPFWCSPDGLAELRAHIAEEKLDRILVAGCSPRTHGAHLQSLAEESGLNWNFCRMVNLREHCARVHPGDSKAATEKALRLVRLGVAAARNAEAIDEVKVEISPSAVVIGGGIAGMTAALSLARRGIPVSLIEKEAELGGAVRSLSRLYSQGVDAREFLKPRIDAVRRNERIEVLLSTRMTDLKGHAGAFEVVVEKNGKGEALEAGAVIIATGAAEWIPEAEPGSANVISLTEFHNRLRAGDPGADRITFVLSSDGPTSRIPASVGMFAHSVLELAGHIQEIRPKASIAILFQDMPESACETARKLFQSGARFVRYSAENPPGISATAVEVLGSESGEQVKIDSDLTVRASGLSPSEGTRLAGGLPVLWQDENGFLMEPYLRLRSGEVFDRGIYVAGTAHGPSGITESMVQAFGAAARALRFLRAGTITKRALVAVVEEEVCRGCGQCEDVCAFGAARLHERERGIRKSEIDDILCVGCGFCVSECISGAIRLPYQTDRQVRSVVAPA